MTPRPLVLLSLAAATCGLVLLPVRTAIHAAAPVRVTPDANAPRSSIPDLYKWQLAPLFESDADLTQALASLEHKRKALAAFKGTLKSPRKLRECLALYFETRLLTNKATLYANMRLDSAQSSTELQANNDRALDAMNGLMSQASFIRQELLALDEKALQAAYKKEPKLKDSKPYIDELRRRRSRVLNAEAERVLSLAGDNLWAEIDLNELPSDLEKTFGALLTDLPLPTIKDEKGKPVQLTFSSYGKYRASSDRRVRKDTVESFFGSLMQYRHALASTLSGQFRQNIFYARSRGYDTALAAYLDKDNIDPRVYTNLIDAIHQNLAPLHRYVKLRKRIMKVDELHIYDLYTPMVKSVKMSFPYDVAQQVLPQALAPLGTTYVEVLRKGLDPAQGWIDVYPHKDKDSGAFSSSVFGVHPYVKMNYFDEHDDLSTLAHEYGHALHSDLSMSTQPYVTASYAPFVAEIASTCNEKLLHDFLYQQAKTDDERMYLLNELVETIRTTIYRQTLFAEFEWLAHTAAEAGTPLTADWFNATYEKLIRQYYGPDFTLGANDGVEWAYIPHFYYKYYMFSYATGLSSGIAIAERIQKGGDKEREAYLNMLRGGNSKPPLELLKGAGVDLTKPDAVNAAAALLDRTLAEMEAILARKPTK
ncbi:MAG: oligoendopeptidase F [Pseudomonadota bacterium]